MSCLARSSSVQVFLKKELKNCPGLVISHTDLDMDMKRSKKAWKGIKKYNKII
jgi:hypothetical protein